MTKTDDSPVLIIGKKEAQILKYIFIDLNDPDSDEISLHVKINTFLRECDESN